MPASLRERVPGEEAGGVSAAELKALMAEAIRILMANCMCKECVCSVRKNKNS